jgi:hypothetical protein
LRVLLVPESKPSKELQIERRISFAMNNSS